METLTRLVTESLARHGFDRPVDYRRLQWSHWFRCESHHSLLIVPSKPGVFALAEEVMDIPDRGTTSTLARPLNLSEAKGSGLGANLPQAESRRMLAVTKFYEDDDMAYVLDRMLSHHNPLQARLASGHYFVRFVVIEDAPQRHSICSALNQWIVSSAEKATGIGSHFATSLELTPKPPNTGRPHRRENAEANQNGPDANRGAAPESRLNSAVATTIHCSSSFPSGF